MAANVKVRVNPRWSKEIEAVGVARLLERKALEVEREAKRRCPVDTGNLRRSITSAVILRPEVAGVVIATAHYAAYVEYGTARTRRQPFLRTALLAVAKRPLT